MEAVRRSSTHTHALRCTRFRGRSRPEQAKSRLRTEADTSAPRASADGELAHHAVVFVLQDVAMEHERRLATRRVFETGGNLGPLAHEHRVLPAAVLRTR